MNFIGLIYKEEDYDYGVIFPDFPGCVSAGKTLEEARINAKEALTYHVEILIDMKQSIPSPTTLEDVMSQDEFNESVAFLVNLPTQKSVRVNVTFQQDVLKLIDRRAKKCHLTRSAFLAEAAKNYKVGSSDKNI